jgi:hypothetical protein
MITASIILLVLLAYAVNVITGKQVIEDANGDPYLVRYFIYRPDWLDKIGIDSKKAGRIYLHNFLRSDYDRALHDHPWNFVSLILTKGYWEYGDVRQISMKEVIAGKWEWTTGGYEMRAFHKPFRVVRRGAGWRHRVQLVDGTEPWTLVFIGPKVRSWGFWTTPHKWCPWQSYSTRTGICDEGREVDFR